PGQPLEPLVMGRLVREQIGRGLKLHGAKLVQLPPQADARAVPPGRQRVKEQKPRFRFHLQHKSIHVIAVSWKLKKGIYEKDDNQVRDEHEGRRVQNYFAAYSKTPGKWRLTYEI